MAEGVVVIEGVEGAFGRGSRLEVGGTDFPEATLFVVVVRGGAGAAVGGL